MNERPLLSAYGTVYNNARTVRTCIISLSNILNKLSENWEIVIADNYSTDGTFEILKALSEKYPIKIIREKCSRGKGRDIALKSCSGTYVFYIDLDTTFREYLEKLLRFYISFIENKDRKAIIYPLGFTYRDNAIKIGGWRDLNHGEDTEFATRACIFLDMYTMMIPPPYSEEPVVQTHRRRRYARKGFKYVKRLLRDRVDSLRACAPNYRTFKEVYIANARSTYAKVFKCIAYLIARTLGMYQYVRQVRNNELVQYRSDIILPDEAGFEKNMLYLQVALDTLGSIGMKLLIIKLLKIIRKLGEEGYDYVDIAFSKMSKMMYIARLEKPEEEVVRQIMFIESIRGGVRSVEDLDIVRLLL